MKQLANRISYAIFMELFKLLFIFLDDIVRAVKLSRLDYAMSLGFGKGVRLSPETNETHANSCNCFLRKASTLLGLHALSVRKEWPTAGLYGLNSLRLHAAYNA